MSERQAKVASFIQTLAGEFLRNLGGDGSSLITVIHADVSPDLRRSTVFVTVLPSEREGPAVEYLNRHASEFRGFVKRNWSMRRLPFFTFALDVGERNRQRLDEIQN